MNNHYCYILENTLSHCSNRTYNGYTVNLQRRLRQHNGEIKGGAKYTTRHGMGGWKYLVIVAGFPTMVNALQCEWRIKHPDNKRIRPSKYRGPIGRIIGLNSVLHLPTWTNQCKIPNSKIPLLNVYAPLKYHTLFTDLHPNIQLNDLIEFIQQGYPKREYGNLQHISV